MSSPDNDEEDAEPPSDSIYHDEDDPEFDGGVLEASANLRKEEYESLKAIYTDDNIEFKEWENRFGFCIRINQMRLEIVTGPRYPLLETPLNISVSGLSLDESVRITDVLTNLADAKLGSIVLFDLVEEARTLVPQIDKKQTEEPTKTEDRKSRFPPARLEALDDDDAAVYMKGVTLQMIAQRLQKDNVTILHAEKVMNHRLVSRFKGMRSFLTKKYERERGRHVGRLLSTEVVFHGTSRRFIANIVSRGFIKPGDVMNDNGDRLQVRCGSTYGRGIYTSADPRFSMSYSDFNLDQRLLPGQKLIVCAVLMGRRLTCGRGIYRSRTSAFGGYDSHVSNTGFEYIVFNSGQLLPLYVLHVTNGDPNLESYWTRRVQQGPPVNIKQSFDVLSERRKTGIAEIDESETYLTQAMQRKIMTKLAKKHFPLGFGPAVGDKFVVEEIGEVDDDEEEWGEYQLDRNAYVREGEGVSMAGEDEEGEETGFVYKGFKGYRERDEFQSARNS
jgi:hypothetical protein